MKRSVTRLLVLCTLAVGTFFIVIPGLKNGNISQTIYDTRHTTASKDINSLRTGMETDKESIKVENKMLQGELRRSPNMSRNNSECMGDVIHVCIVCAGYKAARDVTTVIKSLLFHRTSTIHFHFIVDKFSLLVLETLFKTWGLPSVRYSFYSTSLILKDVSWVPNSHYSGVFGLMKLQLPYVLPPSVDRVILLDTDIVLSADITDLWSFFSEFKPSQYLGLVENLSEWYIISNLVHWPALNRGFNTGVMLMNMKQMREGNWAKLWPNTTKKYLRKLKWVQLADQDVINAIIRDFRGSIVYKLPCTWNVQITPKATFEPSCYSATNAKVLHFNSPTKLGIVFQDQRARFASDLFKKMYYVFVQYDGNLLRERSLPFSCDESEPIVPLPRSAIDKLLASNQELSKACSQVPELRQHSQGRLHLYYIAYNYTAKPWDITLVAQLNFDDVVDLETLCENWSGPMSLTLYFSDYQAYQFHELVKNSAIIKKRTNIGFHVVYKTGSHYPVNYLRNVALSHSSTKYVFLTDVNLIPMSNMHLHLQTVVQQQQIVEKKIALIVAAFTLQHYVLKMPSNKRELKKLIDSGQIKIPSNDAWPSNHSPTNYSHWFQSNQSYLVSWKPNYKPSIVVSKEMVPKYDERFFSSDLDKISHIMEVDAQGFKLVVVPDAFIIRSLQPHNLAVSQYSSISGDKQCLDALKKDFIKDLSRRYGEGALKYLSND